MTIASLGRVSLFGLLGVTLSFAGGCTKSTPSSSGFVSIVTTAQCTSDGGPSGFCFSGTVGTTAFTAPIKNTQANLFNKFPAGGASAFLTQQVAPDGTWAFSGLLSGFDYYLQIVVTFANAPVPEYQLFGPFTVDQSGTPIALQIKPVELDVLESGEGSGPLTVSWARAHVFDPSSGAENQGMAQVAITIGTVSTPLIWDGSAYVVTFANPPPAELSYTMTTQDPSLGPMPLNWQLVSNPPASAGPITSPPEGAAIPSLQPLSVGWTPEPVDYVSLELFESQGAADAGVWQLVYPPPADLDAAAEGIQTASIGMGEIETAAGFAPGQYLLNVDYANSNCPIRADGCVAAALVSAETLSFTP